jgi:hypothetical protein
MKISTSKGIKQLENQCFMPFDAEIFITNVLSKYISLTLTLTHLLQNTWTVGEEGGQEEHVGTGRGWCAFDGDDGCGCKS